jgi:hypothetical protein
LGQELSSHAFSYCPHCGVSLTAKNVGTTNFAFRNITKISANTKNMLLKLASNSDTAVDILKNVVDNFDDIPVDFRNDLLAKISNGSRDPRLAKAADALLKNSPTIAEIAVGFTPLSPYSRVISKFVENVVNRQDRGKKINNSLDSFL